MSDSFDPTNIDEYIKCSLTSFFSATLDNIYFEPSYKQFKAQFTGNLLKYLNLDNQYYENSIQVSRESLIETLKNFQLFRKDPYSIPLFLLTFSIKDGEYDARNLFLIRNINQCLKLNTISFEKYEDSMINLINQIPQQEKGVFKSNKMKKYCKIAGATIIGGTLLGVTGGLIAPFLAASSGIILGSAGATLLGTTAGVSIIGSLFGLTGATLTGYKMKQRAGALEEFRFERIGTNSNRKRSTLAITVAVSGWVSKDCDFATPWRDLRITREAYTLRWDGRHLQRFGHGMDYLVSWAASTVVQEILQETVLAALMASVSWPLTLVSLAGVIDNPWGVCFTRAREAGLELANVLITGVAGRRPVTLIGFSLGARVIYHALEFLCQLLSPPKGTKSTAMARGGSAKSVGGRCIDSQLKPCSSEGSLLQIFSPKRHLVPDAKKYTDHIYLLEPRSDKNNLTPNKSSDNLNLNDSYSNNLATADTDLCLKGKDPRGVIADVILMGAPIPSHDDSTYGAWMDVVGGTVTNCYCTKDWILSFLYRTSSAQISIAGLEPLTLTLEGQQHPRLINVNLTSVVTGHNDYVGKMPDILKTLGYHAISYQD